MNTQNISTSGVRVKNTTDLWCPVCGAPMYEADRLHEGHYSFVWFECSRHGCNGQWLHRGKLSENKHADRIRTA